jgi:Protein of unknown function (DUF2948)
MLHIAAFDSEDLALLSAQMQDAVASLGDMKYIKRARQFVVLANRFSWDSLPQKLRRRSGLKINGVLNVKRRGPTQLAASTVFSLLSLTFVGNGKTDDPAGVLTLAFSGGHTIALDVECIDVQLDDLGPAWSALGLPDHDA